MIVQLNNALSNAHASVQFVSMKNFMTSNLDLLLASLFKFPGNKNILSLTHFNRSLDHHKPGQKLIFKFFFIQFLAELSLWNIIIFRLLSGLKILRGKQEESQWEWPWDEATKSHLSHTLDPIQVMHSKRQNFLVQPKPNADARM